MKLIDICMNITWK